jgi:GT2 family glycosyltransferase
MDSGARRVTVVVPTLDADDALRQCLGALDAQTFRDFETVVVDNGRGPNLGFGGGVNRGARGRTSEFVATINDDAVADPGWLAALVAAAESNPRAGMFASRVLLDAGRLDSAGMLIARDGSSKQRGHGQPPSRFDRAADVLCPSGCAAMYRRTAFDEAGGFDEDFFLYCEDTDLGLRLQWAGWSCDYVPDAVVMHRYSHTAGRVSPLKAYLVERNRLRVVAKNFPLRAWPAARIDTLVRFWWHLSSVRSGRGAAGEFARDGGALRLLWYVAKARVALLAAMPSLIAKRRRMVRRISTAAFLALARRHSISAREVASL